MIVASKKIKIMPQRYYNLFFLQSSRCSFKTYHLFLPRKAAYFVTESHNILKKKVVYAAENTRSIK